MMPTCLYTALRSFNAAETRRKFLGRQWLWLLFLLGWILPATVQAQGSVLPLPVAPGAEALGRGGAFAAKADSPLALEYNVAGLAQLRGTQVLLDAQLWMPVDGGPCQDFQNRRPRPCYGGLVAVSTDFGVLRRWTFALGFRLPELVTAYGLHVQSTLDPGSFPVFWPPALVLAPSLAVGVQAHRRLALGLAVEDAMAISFIPCPTTATPSAVTGCSKSWVGQQSLLNPVVQLGLLANLGPTSAPILFAASVRSAPNFGLAPLLPGASLPWTVRTGLRYLHRSRRTGQPLADVELDGVAQLWMPEDQPPLSTMPRSSLGLRLGGSYQVALRRARLAFRGGFLIDRWLSRPATNDGWGSVVVTDSQQVYVLAGTLGVGVQTQHLALDLGYGYVSQLQKAPFASGPSLRREDVHAESHLMSLSLLVKLESAAAPRR